MEKEIWLRRQRDKPLTYWWYYENADDTSKTGIGSILTSSQTTAEERDNNGDQVFFFELTVQMSLTDTAVVKRATGGSFLYVFFIYLFNIKVKPYKNVNGVRMFYALQSIILLHEATRSRKAGEVGHKKEIEKSGRVMIIFKPNNTSCILAH